MPSAGNELALLEGRPGRSPIEWFLPDGTFRATQQYLCDWGDRDQVIINASLGPYPHRPAAKAYLYGANIVGIGKSGDAGGGLVNYEKALVTLEFSSLAPWPTVGYKFVTEQLLSYQMQVPVPTTDLRWDSAAGTAIDETIGAFWKPVSALIYSVKFYHVLSPPATILTLKDGCNATAMPTVTLSLGFAAETVWYRDCLVSRTVELGGGFDFIVELDFIWRPASWNYQWWRGAWHPVYNAVTGVQEIFHTPVNLNIFFT